MKSMPTETNRCSSRVVWSSRVIALRSSSTPSASEKRTPCFRRLLSAFRRSQVTAIYALYAYSRRCPSPTCAGGGRGPDSRLGERHFLLFDPPRGLRRRLTNVVRFEVGVGPQDLLTPAPSRERANDRTDGHAQPADARLPRSPSPTLRLRLIGNACVWQRLQVQVGEGGWSGAPDRMRLCRIGLRRRVAEGCRPGTGEVWKRVRSVLRCRVQLRDCRGPSALARLAREGLRGPGSQYHVRRRHSCLRRAARRAALQGAGAKDESAAVVAQRSGSGLRGGSP